MQCSLYLSGIFFKNSSKFIKECYATAITTTKFAQNYKTNLIAIIEEILAIITKACN